MVVITGDNKYTAEAICEEIGVFDDSSNISEKSLTGTDLLSLPKNEQINFLFKDKDGRVFSRVEPAQKQTIVQILKEQGEIVAMTGTIHFFLIKLSAEFDLGHSHIPSSCSIWLIFCASQAKLRFANESKKIVHIHQLSGTQLISPHGILFFLGRSSSRKMLQNNWGTGHCR